MKKLRNIENYRLISLNKKEIEIIENINDKYNKNKVSILFEDDYHYVKLTVDGYYYVEILKIEDDYYIIRTLEFNGHRNILLIDQLKELKTFLVKILTNKVLESKLENESIEEIDVYKFNSYTKIQFDESQINKFDSLVDKYLSLIHISEPTRLGMISYAVFCLKKKK